MPLVDNVAMPVSLSTFGVSTGRDKFPVMSARSLPLVVSLRLGRGSDVRLRAAAGVPISQVLLAVAGYLLLALAARTMPAADFAAISAFYLLLNTIGRGVFASVELESSRVLAAADAAGGNGFPVLVTAVRRAAVLLVIAIALSLAATPLLPGVDIAVALALGSCTMAVSYCVRGPLAARRRFRAYSLTFLLEAAFTLLGAAALALTGVNTDGGLGCRADPVPRRRCRPRRTPGVTSRAVRPAAHPVVVPSARRRSRK